MRITNTERFVIGITAALLLIFGAFYLGRATADTGVVIAVDSEIPSVFSVYESFSDDLIDNEEVLSQVEHASSAEGIIDLNDATAEDLESLPGIGPVLAGRILEYRDANGGFKSVDELKNVSGIGDKIFASIENLVEVVN